MPKMTEREFARWLREEERENGPVRFVHEVWYGPVPARGDLGEEDQDSNQGLRGLSQPGGRRPCMTSFRDCWRYLRSLFSSH